MKLALLGIDSLAVDLLRRLVTGGDHALVSFFVDAEQRADPSNAQLASQLRSLAPLAESLEEWHGPPTRPSVDAVVVAWHENEKRLVERMRHLAATQIPVLFSHPITLSVLALYEIEMVTTESDTVLVPYLPDRFDPTFQRLVRASQSADRSVESVGLGRIEQLVFDRSMADHALPKVFRQYARDVDLIRQLLGDVTRIAAMGTTNETNLPAQLSAQMSSPSGALATWSLDPVQATDEAQITLIGSAGKATLVMPFERHSTVEFALQDAATAKMIPPPPGEASDSATVAIGRLVHATSGQGPRRPQWRDVVRSAELAEALEKSLRKGRVVQLDDQPRGEGNAFKGTMASLGCFLLLGGLVALIFAGLVLKLAQVQGFDWVARIVGNVPYLILAVLVGFLLLQLLRFVIPASDDDTGTDT